DASAVRSCPALAAPGCPGGAVIADTIRLSRERPQEPRPAAWYVVTGRVRTPPGPRAEPSSPLDRTDFCDDLRAWLADHRAAEEMSCPSFLSTPTSSRRGAERKSCS